MKYISLKCLMREYAQVIKTHRTYYAIDDEYLNTQIAHMPKQPFTITTRTIKEAETIEVQQIKEIRRISSHVHPRFTFYSVPQIMECYPILELEWCRISGNGSKELLNHLEILSYKLLFALLSWNIRDYYSAHDDDLISEYNRILSQRNIIVELDDLSEEEFLEDVPHILSHMETLTSVCDIKRKNWKTYVMYGLDFKSLFFDCATTIDTGLTNWINQIRSWYASLPCLYTFFLLDEKTTLKNESSSTLWEMNQQIQFLLDALYKMKRTSAVTALPAVYTYWRVNGSTTCDIELFEEVLTELKDGVERLLSQVSAISYHQYSQYSHQLQDVPLNVNVWLSDMRRDWTNELEQAARKKQEEESL